MKKNILFCLFFSLFLNSMDAPRMLQQNPLSMNNWEFFSESNDLDKMNKVIPFWDEKKNLSIETVAHLHVLEQSNLSEKDSIFNPACSKGDIAYFLAHKGNQVTAYTHDKKDMINAIEKFKHPNLNFSHLFGINKYDLIISCNPIADRDLLAKLKCLLNPHGEIFCLFNTKSNKKSVLHQAFENMNPLLEKQLPYFQYNIMRSTLKEMFRRPSDDKLQKLIAELNLEILTYKQSTFDILIMKQHHEKFLATCKAIFMELPRSFESHTETRMNKLANNFIGRIVNIIKKDEAGNWFYPFDFTIVHLKTK